MADPQNPIALPDPDQWLKTKQPAAPSGGISLPDPDAWMQARGAGGTNPLGEAKPIVSPGASDEEIIRSFGYDPKVIQSSPRYQASAKEHGNGLAHMLTAPRSDLTAKIADSPGGDLGRGFLDVPVGIIQLARHGAAKLGMLSDADVQYGDLVDRMMNQDYLENVRHGNANHLLRIAGNMLFPGPQFGNAESLAGAVAKGAAGGAVTGALQPVLSGNPEDFASEKLGQAGTGAAVGGGLGAGGYVAGRGAKMLSALAKTRLPENAAGAATKALQKTMDDTPWGSLQDIEQTAAEGGERAGSANQVLDQIRSADTPKRVMQASLNSQRFRMSQLSDSLYHDVEEMIKQRGVGSAPMTATASALRGAEANAALGIKDPGLNSALKEVRRIITPEAPQAPSPSGLLDAGGNPIRSARPAPQAPNAPYDEARKMSSQIEEIIRNKRTGENALVGDRSIPLLQKLKDSIDQDLHSFTQNQGIPELRAAGKMADDFYRQSVVPYKDLKIAREASSDETDHIFDTFVQQGGRDRATKFYNALDPKGQAAVKYQMVLDGLNKATDPVKGFNSAKFTKSMDGVQDAYNVFFQGKDRADMDALKNLVLQAAKVDAKPISGAPGMALSMVPRSDKVLKYLMTTDRGRMFLYAARGLQPDTPALSNLYGKIEAAATRGVTSPGAQTGQSAPPPPERSKSATPALATAQ